MSSVTNTGSRYQTYMQNPPAQAPQAPSQPQGGPPLADSYTVSNGIMLRAREVVPQVETPVVPAPPGSQGVNGEQLVSITEQLQRVDALMLKFQQQSSNQEGKQVSCVDQARRLRRGHLKETETNRNARADKLLGNAAQASVFFDEALERETQLARFRNALETMDGMVELQQIVQTCQQYKVDPNLLPNLENAVTTMNSASVISNEPFAGLSEAQKAKANEYKDRMKKELGIKD